MKQDQPSSVTVEPGAFVAAGSKLEEGVFIGANAVVLGEGDRYCLLRSGAKIGANATILAGVEIGEHACVAPGSVVKSSVPARAIVDGNPAVIVGYVDTPKRLTVCAPGSLTQSVQRSEVAGVALYALKQVSDLRGSLSVGEFERDLPFVPKRYFIVFDVPSAEARGEHAHRRCHQFLIAIKGQISVLVDDGSRREEFLLAQPNIGLHLPAMVWGTQSRYSPDAMLLVFASELYDPEDYIRDYGEFIRAAESAHG